MQPEMSGRWVKTLESEEYQYVADSEAEFGENSPPVWADLPGGSHESDRIQLYKFGDKWFIDDLD